MKSNVLILLISILPFICNSQTEFFNNIENSTWFSVSNITESAIKESKQIPLGKMKFAKDSLKENVTVWNFKDGLLTISNYSHKEKKENLLTTLKYSALPDKDILIIYFQGDQQTYKIGLTSTGNNALLIRQKKKTKK